MTRHDLIAADFRHHCHGACCASCRQPASYADRLPQYRLPSRPTTKPDLCLAFSTRSAGSSSPKQPVARLSSEQSRQRALATFPIAPEQPAPSFNPASMRSPPTTQRVARLGPRPHRTLKIPRNNQKLYIDERFRQLGLSAPRRPTDSASLNRSQLDSSGRFDSVFSQFANLAQPVERCGRGPLMNRRTAPTSKGRQRGLFAPTSI